jgi:hypothetical protein
MSFVDLPRFKNNSTDYMSQKISEKVRRKKIMGNISKKSAEKNPLNPLKSSYAFFRVIYPTGANMMVKTIYSRWRPY